MTQKPTRNSSVTLGLAVALTLAGCTGSGGAGCGAGPSQDQEPSPEDPAGLVEAQAPASKSTLLGTYRITAYRGSDVGCEALTEADDSPSFVVFYPFSASGGEVGIGGTFCAGAEDCARVAKQATEPAIGYSFLRGSDDEGWRGYGLADTGVTDEQCRAVVQAHTLTSTGEDTIRIETRTVETLFQPFEDEAGQKSCRNRDAVDSVTDALECRSILVAEATRE